MGRDTCQWNQGNFSPHQLDSKEEELPRFPSPLRRDGPDFFFKKGTSLAVQWLRLCASNAGGAGSIPGRVTKIPHAKKKIKKKQREGPGRSWSVGWSLVSGPCLLHHRSTVTLALLTPRQESQGDKTRGQLWGPWKHKHRLVSVLLRPQLLWGPWRGFPSRQAAAGPAPTAGTGDSMEVGTARPSTSRAAVWAKGVFAPPLPQGP